jgi:50S ribosomal subunit-associated GTPase HflX
MYDHAVRISARTGDRLDELVIELGAMLRPVRALLRLEIPHTAPHAMARLHSVGQILESDYRGKHARFIAQVPPHLTHEFQPYLVNGSEKNVSSPRIAARRDE